MTDQFANTRYRVAQHWRFQTETPEARDTLVVTAVEDHPTQGIICGVRVEYDPPFQSSPNSFGGGGEYWFTQAALDASVTEQVAEKGFFPRHLGTTGEFRRDAESWGPNPHPFADTRTVGEVVREAFAQMVRQRDEDASRPPSTDPPDESLADSLEDAGCSDRAILDHLRASGPHVRGCWAVDLLLGKKSST